MIPTLGPKVCRYDLLWAIWSPRVYLRYHTGPAISGLSKPVLELLQGHSTVPAHVPRGATFKPPGRWKAVILLGCGKLRAGTRQVVQDSIKQV